MMKESFDMGVALKFDTDAAFEAQDSSNPSYRFAFSLDELERSLYSLQPQPQALTVIWLILTLSISLGKFLLWLRQNLLRPPRLRLPIPFQDRLKVIFPPFGLR
jgi:hypothetical protein